MKSFACFNLSANPLCAWTDHFSCHTRNTKSPAKSLCFTKEQKKYASEPFKSESARVLVACTRNLFLWVPPLFLSCRMLNILRSGPKAILEWIHVWNFQPIYCFSSLITNLLPSFAHFLFCFCWESASFGEYIDKVHTFWFNYFHLKSTRKKTFCWGCRSNIF